MQAVLLRSVLATACIASLAGCASTRMLKSPLQSHSASIGAASDAAVDLRIEGLVVRDGPGSWTRKAYWDEYMVVIRNLGVRPIRVEGLSIADPMQQEVAASADRRTLARETRRNLKRYKVSGMDVKPGASSAGLVAGGSAMAVGGVGVAGSAAATGVLGGGGSGALLAAGAGVAVGGVAILGAGIDRAIQNGRIQDALDSRALATADLSPATDAHGSVFFPLVPAPQRFVLHYRDGDGQARELAVELAPTLSQLHLVQHD